MRASLRYLVAVSVTVLGGACSEKGTVRPSHGDAVWPGTAGAGPSANAGGAGGAAATQDGSEPVDQGKLAYGFDEGLEDWRVQYTSSAEPDDLIATSDVVVEWSEDEGRPGGALRATIPYDAPGQYVAVGIALTGEGLDLGGKIISADVKIVSGVGSESDLSSNPAGAKIYAKSGTAYVYANGVFTNVDAIGEWVTIRFSVEDPDFADEAAAAFDPSQILELGVQFDTSGTSKSATEGVVLVDNIRY
jgi:hypothetical protein